MVEELRNIGVIERGVIYDAQLKAISWLANKDAKKIPIDFSNQERVNQLVQRYVLAVFFDVTGGHDGKWSNTTNWLKKSDICDWFGVECINFRVTELNLGTMLPSIVAGLVPSRLRFNKRAL